MSSSLEALWQSPSLRPLAPLVLSAWHDGHLTPAELLAIREALAREESGLATTDRETIARWLDPEAPPSAHALKTLEHEVARWLSALPSEQRRSLTSIRAALGEGHVGATRSEAARVLLTEVEDALGFEDFTPARAPVREQRVSALDGATRERLRAALDGEQRALRDELRQLLRDDARFRLVSELSTHDYREQVLAWLRALCEQGLVARCYPRGFEQPRDLARFVASFETLALFDLSLVVKFGVQAGLFCGALESLGTARHHALLPAAARAELLGCFAMTERGHGSNVRALETVARYEPASESFVLHTPTLSAGKEWIGNAARHARMAIVFAALETGGERYGVHAFLVAIRAADGRPERGVRIEDCGEKMGLNGVDNGRLWFDELTIPRSALLDRFGQVSPSGEYESRIPSESKRFFTMLSTLVGGRISVAGGAISAAKVGLTIAVRYALCRTQFADASGQEKPLFSYLTHRRRLLPRLAAAYAYSFAQQELVARAARDVAEEGEAAVALRGDVETLAAGFKALATWQTIDTLQQCRECCGGQGYLTSNRIDALRTDSDVFTTFEGDNTVLLQLVANNLLRELRRALARRPVRTLVSSLLEDVKIAVADRNPVAVRDVDDATLRSFELHASALRFREKSLLMSLARRITRRVRDGEPAQQAFDACQDHALALARAHIERFVVEAFQRAAEAEPALRELCALYGLWCLERDLTWFLESGYVAPAKSRAVRKSVNGLLDELAPHASDLVEAFAIPETCLGPLADPAYLAASGLAARHAQGSD